MKPSNLSILLGIWELIFSRLFINKNYFVLKYEDFVTDPEKSLKEIFQNL